MKVFSRLLIIVVITSLFCITSMANEADKYIDDFAEVLPDGYENIPLNSAGLTDAVGFRALLSEIGSAIEGQRGEIGSFFLLILGCSVIISVASIGEGAIIKYSAIGVSVICSVTVFTRIFSVVTEMSCAIAEMSRFFSSAMPIALALTAAGGGASSASVGAMGMNLTLSLVGGVGNGALLFAVSLSFALSLLAVFGAEGIQSVVRGVRNFYMWVLGIVTALLMGTLSLQGLIASATDSAAMRAAKYAASGMIPVVGGTVSASLSTLLSGLEYAKSVIGVGAVLVIVSIAILPLITLLLYRLALSCAVTMLDFLGIGVGREPFSSFRSSLDALTATYSISAIIYIFQLLLFLKGGVRL